MSVVRKYNTGGKAPTNYSDYKDFIIKKLGEEKFTTKGEKEAREVAGNWVGLVESPDFNNNYSYDQVKQEYSVKSDNLPENLKTIDWSGSKDAIKKNFFGQFTATPDASNKGEEGNLTKRKFNTLFSNWTNEYLSSKNPAGTVPTTTSGISFKIKDLGEYVKQKHYGDNENYQTLWDTYKKEKLKANPEAIKADIMEKAKEHILEFGNKVQNPGEGNTYEDITNKDNLLKAIESKDWVNFTVEANKLGWDPADLAQMQEETTPDAVTETSAETPGTVPTPETPSVLPMGRDAEPYKPETNQWGMPITGAVDTGLGEIDLDKIMPNIKEYTVDVNDFNVVDDIYSDIENNYELDAPRLGQIKWLWKNKHLLTIPQQEKITAIVNGLPTSNPIFKEGGVIKLQAGDKLKSLKVKIATGNTMHNMIHSPMSAEKAFAATSAAATTASMVPVPLAGAIGGAALTLSDIGGDISKDGFQWTDIVNWNTAANLGFTALGVFGAGGLGATLKLAKAAKVADTALDVGKAVEKLGVVAKDLGAAEDLVKIAGKVKNPTAARLSNSLSRLTEGNATKILGREVKAAELPQLKQALSEDLKNLLISENKATFASTMKMGAEKILGNKTLRAAAKLGVAAQAVPSVIHMSEQAFTSEGKLGNITVEDASNIAKAGIVGTNLIKGMKIDKALARQVESTKVPQQSALTITDAAGEKTLLDQGLISGELPQKEGLKGVSKVWGRGAAKEKANKAFSKAIIEKYNATVSDDKKIPLDAIVSKIESVSPAKIVGTALKARPSTEAGQGLDKARKEYDLASKTLKKYGIDTSSSVKKILSASEKESVKKLAGDLKGKISRGKVVDEQFDAASERLNQIKANTAKWKKIPKGMQTTISKLEQSTSTLGSEKASLATSKEELMKQLKAFRSHKEGGILKAQWGARVDYPRNYDIGRKAEKTGYANQTRIDNPINYGYKTGTEKPWRMPISPLPVYPPSSLIVVPEQPKVPVVINPVINKPVIKKPNLSFTPGSFENELDVAALDGTNATAPKVYKEAIVENQAPAQAPIVGSAPTPLGNGAVTGRTIDWGKLKGLAGNADLLNAIGFLGTKLANTRIAREQKAAALAGITHLKAPGRQYFRSPNLVQPFYDKQANDTMNRTRILGEKTSNLDQAMNIFLAGNKQAQDIKAKGQGIDAQAIQNTINQQMQSDVNTDRGKIDVVNKNAMIVSDAAKSMHLIGANKTLADNAARTAYIHALKQNSDSKKFEDKYKNYYNLATSPEYSKMYKDYTGMETQLAEAKKAWDAKSKSTEGTATSTFEESQGYKNVLAKREYIQGLIQDYQKKVSNASLALQMPGSFAKGGTIEEKKELMRYRSQLKKSEDSDKEFYKTILKNNELMLKSLIKVFK